jgi:hypothetical protein
MPSQVTLIIEVKTPWWSLAFIRLLQMAHRLGFEVSGDWAMDVLKRGTKWRVAGRRRWGRLFPNP